MKIRCTITLTAAVLLLTACAQPGNSIPGGAASLGNGMYQITDYGFMGGAGTVAARAAETCSSLGKKLTIVGNSMQVGITGTQYPLLIFRCE